jgi:hypothetical protein
VRHIVRPFIKEFKNRSIRSTPGYPNPIGAVEDDGPKPPFMDLGVFGIRQANSADDRNDALKAAEAVFGKSSAGASVPETSPSSNARVGRILPSLLAADDSRALQSTNPDEKISRRQRRPKTENPSAIRREKPTLERSSEVARVAEARRAASSVPEISTVSAPRRERPIQKRWVLATALKAGEKWKRRLPQAAR